MVAARHVKADRIAEDVAFSLILRNVVAARFQRHHKLAFIVIVAGEDRIRDFAAVFHDGIGRLHEDHRRIALVGIHLDDVGHVVLADAIDATDRKLGIGADNIEMRGGRG